MEISKPQTIILQESDQNNSSPPNGLMNGHGESAVSLKSLQDELKSRFAPDERFTNRELSWLEFNERVLEEAFDSTVPVFERLKFLAITASNLDEFFMVRVAAVYRQIEANIDRPGPDGLTPAQVLAQITRRVNLLHLAMGRCLHEHIMPALADAGIFLVDDKTATAEQVAFANKYFCKTVKPVMTPLAIDSTHPFPQLSNKMLYFCVELLHRKKSKKKVTLRLALVMIPSHVLGRFVQLPSHDDRKYVIRLDDIIRLNLNEVFPNNTVLGCYAIKVVRDAELEYVEDEAQDLLATISASLAEGRKGPATRFLYDAEMPPRVLGKFVEYLRLNSASIFPGARYHSFADFMQFPTFDMPELYFEPMPPLPVKALDTAENFFAAIRQRDILVHHPYQKFDCVVRMIKEAAKDPNVIAIKMTLYRISAKSPIAKALARAAKRGKQVNAIVELKARFDERANISWAKKLEKSGVHVTYGLPRLKTHCKLTMVVRKENNDMRLYCHLSTGNYNDRTSQIYGDIGLFTAREEITREVANVFDKLTGYSDNNEFKYLFVAPENLRYNFIERIRRESAHARSGRDASIIAKMNSLVDPEIIDELYIASQAGVHIQLIIRGMCCLKPGVPGLSDNITVISIIDRFLEHARIFIFENDGQPEYFLASSDWMQRNLNRRVEVAFPVLDTELQQHIQKVIDIQLADNVKARVLKPDSTNERRKAEGELIRAQKELYERYAKNSILSG